MKAPEGLHNRDAITPTYFPKYQRYCFPINFFFFFIKILYICNLEPLVEPQAEENIAKYSFQKVQQHDHGWSWTQIISIKDWARNR